MQFHHGEPTQPAIYRNGGGVTFVIIDASACRCAQNVMRLRWTFFMQMDHLFYRLEIVSERTARMEMRSPRGAVSWEQVVPVDKLVHDEQLLRDRSPTEQERIRRVTRSSAWNHYIGYLSRVALNAGMEWVSLNLRGTDRGFLFSTRQQERLEEEFGIDPEMTDAEGHRTHLVFDRAIPPEMCYCVKTNNARVFARYETVGSRLQIYLSGVTRMDTGQNIAQAEASQAMRHLRRLQVKLPETNAEEPMPPALEARPAQAPLAPLPALADGMSSPADIPQFNWSSALSSEKEEAEEAEPIQIEEEQPAMITVEEKPTDQLATELEEAVETAEEEAETDCPSCGDELFHIAGSTSVCLSCGWSNLPNLDEEDSA